MKEESVDLRAVLRHSQASETGVTDSEARLDALLRQTLTTPAVNDVPEQREDPLDRVRRLFAVDLIPMFDQLRAKYAPSGVAMKLDADNFLNGGRDVIITIEYSDHGLRFHGTVTSNAIAFSQTRFTRSDTSGLTDSGPSLRTRDLDHDSFRDFVCARIAALVQSVMHRR
ncbi:MAG: hypothetical protein H6817_05130 [Phycisphaerales bacterium]|nr:hypothetical protein [Phycisphaerales bacterium]